MSITGDEHHDYTVFMHPFWSGQQFPAWGQRIIFHLEHLGQRIVINHIPIAICTGFSEKLKEESAKSIGIKGFLMKPVVKSEMASMIRKVLEDAKDEAHAEVSYP